MGTRSRVHRVMLENALPVLASLQGGSSSCWLRMEHGHQSELRRLDEHQKRRRARPWRDVGQRHPAGGTVGQATVPNNRVENVRRDLIRSIATFGAPLFVGALLLHRVINGHWASVAFLAIMFTVAFVIYLRFLPRDDFDGKVPDNTTERPFGNGEE